MIPLTSTMTCARPNTCRQIVPFSETGANTALGVISPGTKLRLEELGSSPQE